MCGKGEMCPHLNRVLGDPGVMTVEIDPSIGGGSRAILGADLHINSAGQLERRPRVAGITGYSFAHLLAATGTKPEDILRAAMETDFAEHLRSEGKPEGKAD
jgi:hypothetical protein